MKPYHNTTHLSGSMLQQATTKARSQTDIIYEYLKSHPNQKFTAWSLLDALNGEGHKILVTSCRRSLSDLSKAGHIHHDKGLVDERMQAKNTTYYYRVEKGQLQLL